MTALDDLTAFTELLVSTARDAASPDEPLSRKLTDEERNLLRRMADQLASGVEQLKKIIAAHPYREHGFEQLWAALGSAAIIASHGLIDEIQARIKKESAAGARSKRAAKRHDIRQKAAELGARVRKRRPGLSAMGIANTIMPELNKWLGTLGREPYSSTHAVRKLLRADIRKRAAKEPRGRLIKRYRVKKLDALSQSVQLSAPHHLEESR